jgi:hypothetical protein
LAIGPPTNNHVFESLGPTSGINVLKLLLVHTVNNKAEWKRSKKKNNSIQRRDRSFKSTL